jgi:hypothetical protein
MPELWWDGACELDRDEVYSLDCYRVNRLSSVSRFGALRLYSTLTFA